jgi:adenylate cyclase
MVENRIERRLAAVFAADVAGYSRLMEADEEGTLRELKAHRRELVDPKVVEHHGRIVKTTGDGMLVEFASVVDAVRCAVDIQRGMAERSGGTPIERRLQFRVGINVGDIILDGGDIFGDGVNVAARLEALAEPGTILVSRIVHDQVRDKLPFDFDDLGEQTVKNLSRPVGIYRVGLGANVASKPSTMRVATPDRPSIAVLPFQNMSGNPDQEYFADGIAEDIITALSKLRWFFVIARNSSFTYRDRAVDVKRIARELGVRYVLEGSVRKSNDRVRITAQLIDASTGSHLWADHQDGELTDVFALQDAITRNVVAAIEPRLLEAESLRSQSRSPEDVDAWDLLIRANSLFWRMTDTESEAAIDMLKQAVARFPDYAPAKSMLAFMLLLTRYAVWTSSAFKPQVDESAALAARAAQLDDGDPWAHLAQGFVALTRRHTDEAVEGFRRALELNPNFAAAHGYLGLALALDGRSEEAIDHIAQAMGMSPRDPQNSVFNMALAVAHYLAGRYTEAIGIAQRAMQQRDGLISAHRICIASLRQAGQIEDARAYLEKLKILQPGISIAWVEEFVPYTAAPMAKFVEGLRKAGLR